jgi:hypothetical protein
MRHSTLAGLASAGALASLALLAPTGARAQGWDGDSRVERNVFTWDGAVPSGRWVYVRNLNGGVRVEPSPDREVHVTVDRRTRGDVDPREVRIVQQRAADGQSVVLCALWGDEARCGEDDYRGQARNWSWNRRGSASVEFVVRVPTTVRLDLQTTNGGLDVRGAGGELVANTTNGGIRVEAGGGPVRAHTTNGGVDVRLSALGSARDFDLATTNGAVSLEVPASLGADVEMSTVNGRVETDFPVTVQGRIDPRRLRVTLGNGERRVRLRTTNGSVSLRRGR